MADASGPTSGNLIIQAPNQLIFGTGALSNDIYIKETASGLSISQPVVLTSATLSGLITNYNGIATIGNGVPSLVAKADLTAQAANVGSTLLYTVPANGAGMYRISGYVVVTQAATVSSTLPQISQSYNDLDTSVGTGAAFTLTNTANTVGANSATTITGQNVGTLIFNAKASTGIFYSTSGYASSGATPMQYAIHIKLEYLGA